MGDENWQALAKAVKARRMQQRLPQDLVDRGGPGEMTMRKIERGEPTSIRPKTKVQLERALNWPDGIVDRILDDTAIREELASVWVRDEAPGARADLVVRDSVGFIDTQAADALRGLLNGISPFTETMRQAAAVANVTKQFGPVIETMQAFRDGQVAYTTRVAAMLRRFALPVIPPIDISASLGLVDKFRVMAIPPLRISPEALALYEEYKRIDEKIGIEAQPWFSEDMSDEEIIRRGREQLVVDEAGEPGIEVEPDGADNAEVILGPWGMIVAAQQDLADTDDLALAGELFARVSRRPRSAARDAQLRAVNGLIAELVEEQPTREDDQPRALGAE